MPSDAIVEGVSGAIGGCVATIATYPLMTVTTWQATHVKSTSKTTTSTPPPPPRTTISELIHAVQTNGWASLFPGITASLLGTTVSQGVYFFLYSLLRDSAVSRRRNNNKNKINNNNSTSMTVAESIMVASLAGWGNVLLTNPIWMIATRMQAHKRRPTTMKTTTLSNNNSSKDVEEGSGSGKKGEITPDMSTSSSTTAAAAPPPGPIAVARQVYKEYGLGGFWNGCGASLIMVINPTLQYALYEWLMSAREGVRRRKQVGGMSNSKSGSGSGIGIGIGINNSRPGVLEVFMMSALAKAGATLVTYPMMTIKTRMMSARKEADCEMQYKSIGDAIVKIGSREGVGGYYQGIRTKIVQSVLAAALLLMLKEKITDATKAMLLERKRREIIMG